ncbi:leucyl aminopeptidase family protein [Sneathiella sp. HT1-7]|uniref:leucyl aminopeptidase family protein n=1 Tax=Sneathiella sp. HT1-7 TaxID=2887192 RepID=UPI001D134CFF|nr:leucyl aminopeptidase family protein [Sneathiella sp. HT1-7]MCC3303576.1 leucyl aminopeptidase family protein [Sneathiella sp. HT1-7]
MIPFVAATSNSDPKPIIIVEKENFAEWLTAQSDFHKGWIDSQDYEAVGGKTLLLPGAAGDIEAVIYVKDGDWNIWSLADLPSTLPKGTYAVTAEFTDKEATDVAIGWSLGTYSFDRYKKDDKKYATLMLPDGADKDMVARTVKAVTLVRDLVNLPAGDLGPSALEAAASQVAGEFEAEQENIVGEDLLTYHFPMVHAVGRAAADAPRLIDINWGDKDAPKVTLVGKGVCFDTGGLDIKSAAGMLMMKKDMGGAATVLGLAHMIMDANLPIRLRVIIPAVENSISGNAFHPGDILISRKGKTVEIGNTDAEGRLILADALAAADEEEPDLLIDMATLTGAARVAVGTEIAATFTDDDALFADIANHSEKEKDPVWRLPLWDDYRHLIDSKFADMNNAGAGGYGGAITAGLFLKEFVEKAKSWVHFDVMAYNVRSRPGRPVGGEAFAMRALFALIKERYGKS